MIYPEDHPDLVITWGVDGARFSIIGCNTIISSHYCGYVRLPKRPVRETGYKGILTYVPVHGGITYAQQDEDGSMVYGFDCAHAGDDEDPKYKNIHWLVAECHRMATAISIAAGYEADYLNASEDEKYKIIDEYHERLKLESIEFDLSDNFGAMINLIIGEV